MLVYHFRLSIDFAATLTHSTKINALCVLIFVKYFGRRSYIILVIVWVFYICGTFDVEFSCWSGGKK